MKPPIFVRKLSTDERKRLEAGLRSNDTFTLRRSQMLLASSRGDEVPQIAENLGCGQQTVRDAIHDFDERGLQALTAGSSRPKRTRAAFDERSAERLRELLNRCPREFGRDSSLWTLEMAAGKHQVEVEDFDFSYGLYSGGVKVPSFAEGRIGYREWALRSGHLEYIHSLQHVSV
jgi:transposase